MSRRGAVRMQRGAGTAGAGATSGTPGRPPTAFLDVRDLKVHFPTDDGVVRSVDGLSFTLERGRTLGIVGESGSGKSVTSLAVMGLHGRGGAQVSGEIWLDGEDLVSASPERVRQLRGKTMSMIFQDPLSSLHPYYTVGSQIVEAYRVHHDVSKAVARKHAVDMLGRVGIPRPQARVDDHPHQFSGGMRQRAMIAMALTLNPKLIIADEPTTALDVTVQAQILDLLAGLREEYDAALVMITHDLGVVADIADDVMVMYAGKPVEFADRRTLYYRPHMPYTKGLIESIPTVDGSGGRLKPIQGQPPSLINLPSGCSFRTRCPYVMDQCVTEVPPLRQVAGASTNQGGHRSACWLPVDEVGLGAEVDAQREQVARSRRGAVAAAESVAVDDLPTASVPTPTRTEA